MAQLEQSIKDETQSLQAMEKRIETEATKFDHFLKENDKNSVQVHF